jgi:GxxExxY protein
MAHELDGRGLRVRRQVPVPIRYSRAVSDEGFRADIIVEDQVIPELKSIERTTLADRKRIQAYLRLTGCRLGYLLNFGEALMKQGIVRAVNGLEH